MPMAKLWPKLTQTRLQLTLPIAYPIRLETFLLLRLQLS